MSDEGGYNIVLGCSWVTGESGRLSQTGTTAESEHING